MGNGRWDIPGKVLRNAGNCSKKFPLVLVKKDAYMKQTISLITKNQDKRMMQTKLERLKWRAKGTRGSCLQACWEQSRWARLCWASINREMTKPKGKTGVGINYLKKCSEKTRRLSVTDYYYNFFGSAATVSYIKWGRKGPASRTGEQDLGLVPWQVRAPLEEPCAISGVDTGIRVWNLFCSADFIYALVLTKERNAWKVIKSGRASQGW